MRLRALILVLVLLGVIGWLTLRPKPDYVARQESAATSAGSLQDGHINQGVLRGPIQPGSVQMVFGEADQLTVADDGQGGLSRRSGSWKQATGQIDYVTGRWTLEIETGGDEKPSADIPISVSYHAVPQAPARDGYVAHQESTVTTDGAEQGGQINQGMLRGPVRPGSLEIRFGEAKLVLQDDGEGALKKSEGAWSDVADGTIDYESGQWQVSIGSADGDEPAAEVPVTMSYEYVRQDRLVILSPHWEGIQHEFERGFKEYMRESHGLDVEVDWLDVGGSSKIEEAIVAGTAEARAADLLFGGGMVMHRRLARRGRFGSYRPPAELLERIPADIGGFPNYDEGRWYGACLSGFGILYNREVIRRARLLTPTDWSDLAAPRVHNWLVSGDPALSGSVRFMYEMILQTYGFERGYALLCQMGGNVAAFDDGAMAGPKAVALGQAAYSMCIDFYGEAEVERLSAGGGAFDAAAGATSLKGGQEGPLKFILPEGVTVINCDPIAMLHGAGNPLLAGMFIDFVLSDAGQRLWMLKRGHPDGPQQFNIDRLSICPHLYAQHIANGETNITYNPYDFVRRRGRRFDPSRMVPGGPLKDLLQATIIYPHEDLRRAWAALIEAGMPQDLVAEFGASPISEQGLRDLAPVWGDDPQRRVETMDQWQRMARRKYARIMKQCRERLRRIEPVATTEGETANE